MAAFACPCAVPGEPRCTVGVVCHQPLELVGEREEPALISVSPTALSGEVPATTVEPSSGLSAISASRGFHVKHTSMYTRGRPRSGRFPLRSGRSPEQVCVHSSAPKIYPCGRCQGKQHLQRKRPGAPADPGSRTPTSSSGPPTARRGRLIGYCLSGSSWVSLAAMLQEPGALRGRI